MEWNLYSGNKTFLSWFRCWCFKLFSLFFPLAFAFFSPSYLTSPILIPKSLWNRWWGWVGSAWFLHSTHDKSKVFLHLRHLLSSIPRSSTRPHTPGSCHIQRCKMSFKHMIQKLPKGSSSTQRRFLQLMHETCDKSILAAKSWGWI